MVRNLQEINQYIIDNKERPFEWGVFDCCTMACDIIVLQGGDDFAKDVRGTYSTEIAAKRVLKKHFGSLEEAFSPLAEIDFNFVQRGDLVLFESEGEKVMTFRFGEGYYCIPHEGGMGVLVDTDKPLKAWRVK